MSTRTKSLTVNADAPQTSDRGLFSLDEAAAEAGVSYRFLQLEIGRGRLVAVRLSNRIVRIRRADWERYLAKNSTAASAV
jgi:hypothetical protein